MTDHIDRRKPETLRLKMLMPSLTVADLATSIEFYETLGFVVTDKNEKDGKLLYASLRAGTVELMLGQDDWAQGRDRVKGVGMRLWCATMQDVDEVAAAIKARGGTLATEPTDQPWGARDFSVVDPDGFKISISTGMAED